MMHGRGDRATRRVGLPIVAVLAAGAAIAAGVSQAAGRVSSAKAGPDHSATAFPASEEGSPVSSGGATEVTRTSALIEGSIAATEPASTCVLEWGPTPEFEHSIVCAAGTTVSGRVLVYGPLSGLSPETTYYWRLAAGEAQTRSYGEVKSFQTLGAGRRTSGQPIGHQRDPHDVGLHVAYCAASAAPKSSAGAASRRAPKASISLASHEGWPPDECLKMDKGGPGRSHTLDGYPELHNWLLGGYGNDTIFAGNRGDVIWGDYQPSGQRESERDKLHGGAGNDWIYSSHGSSEIWTGAGKDQLLLVYGHGVVFCNGPGLKILTMRYLPQNRHWKLIGCTHKKINPYKA